MLDLIRRSFEIGSHGVENIDLNSDEALKDHQPGSALDRVPDPLFANVFEFVRFFAAFLWLNFHFVVGTTISGHSKTGWV
jgi:hypothetical protein